MKIAVLALQGDFREHREMLGRLGVDSFEIRQGVDWEKEKDGLILPGGESTTMLKLLNELGLKEPIRESIRRGLPVYGTCAGLILLSAKVVGEEMDRLNTMDIETQRNAYGRQLGSFFVDGNVKGIDHEIPMTFIRAPYIRSVGDGVEVLSEVGGHIVAAREKNQIVSAFHPELNEDLSFHKMFVEMVENNSRK